MALHEVGTEQWVLTYQELILTNQVLFIQEYLLTQVLTSSVWLYICVG